MLDSLSIIVGRAFEKERDKVFRARSRGKSLKGTNDHERHGYPNMCSAWVSKGAELGTRGYRGYHQKLDTNHRFIIVFAISNFSSRSMIKRRRRDLVRVAS